MAHASVASVVGMWAANQDYSTLEKLKDAAALKKRAEDLMEGVVFAGLRGGTGPSPVLPHGEI